MLSIFSGGWVDPYLACTATSIPLSRIYTLLALVIGFFVIFNLFIAILLDSFASEEGEEGEGGAEEGQDDHDQKDSPHSVIPASQAAVDRTLLSFSPLKRFCRWLVNHDLWESFIITVREHKGATARPLLFSAPLTSPHLTPPPSVLIVMHRQSSSPPSL